MVAAEGKEAVCYKINAPFHRLGRGVAGKDVHWFDCDTFKFGDDLTKCFEAVMEEDSCSKDYFTYNTRSDRGCGCMKKGTEFSVELSDCSDYFTIQMPMCAFPSGHIHMLDHNNHLLDHQQA